MTDIEGNTSRPAINNPYAAVGGHPSNSSLANKVFTILKRLLYVGVSLFGLKHFDAYQVILHSPHVSHEWFKIGLAATVGA